ncbi:hypothetical protein B296_00029678 [Ensete ventricosum]|uniref:Uncharacterized protein n=1 Tax=Ensete ventricosum TaxID=4639 RepID=A0A426ZTY6_ENSVE|nr:hypothetical protein B296_00029678 [Ensete ventricosum]
MHAIATIWKAALTAPTSPHSNLPCFSTFKEEKAEDTDAVSISTVERVQPLLHDKRAGTSRKERAVDHRSPPRFVLLTLRSAMLKVSSVAAPPASNTLWFPGTRMEGFAVVPPSKRTAEIAKSREELLRLLHDLPECEYELSLTDLVEKGPVAGDSTTADFSNTYLEEAKSDQASLAKKRKQDMIRSNKRSFRSHSDGVLLRFYMPASLTRSLTTPRTSRGRRCNSTKDCNER